MKTVIKYLLKFKKRMALGFMIKMLATISELMLPLILSHILKNALSTGLREVMLWGVFMVVCSAIALVGNVTANRMAARVSKDFAKELRSDLFNKTLLLSARQADKFTIPSLESRITTDTYNVHSFFNMIQRMGVRAPIILFGGVAVTLFMDAKLSLVMIALMPPVFLTVYFVRRNGVPLYRKVQSSVDGMVRVVREDSQGIRVIKALSKTESEKKRFDGVNKALVKDELKAGVVMGSVQPIMNMFTNISSVAVIALSAYFVSKGSSDPENVIAFMQYFTLISTSLMAVTRIFTMYTKCSASAARIEEVLFTEEEMGVCEKADYPDIKTNEHIVFDKVTFSYNGRKNDLKDISFTVKKGGSIGIIGATGSGKSTVARLLLRFYDPNMGNIYIDGENVRTIPKKELYKRFGTVFQQDFLFADTVRENIAFGRDITDEEIERAARTAQAIDFVSQFEDGFGHMLSQHAANISGGQKQRLLIARAIARHPEILVLDDSSSALDYKTDASLRQALKTELSGTTVVTIAQRVSSIKDCDTIIVLEKGEMIGIGTHDKLLETCPEYKEISDSQMGGAIVD